MTPRRVVVVGGGIAGLSAAYRILELSRERNQSVDLTLLEANAHTGGSITSEHAGGFTIEGGPDSFISEKPWALNLCERLGLTPRLIGTRDELRRTFIVHAGALHALPDGFLLLAPTQFWPLLTTRLFSWPGKLRMALDLILPRRAAQGDESLASFVTRRLGREALERVAQPLVGGIYTADPADLSLAATMPRFLEMERKGRSVIWSMWSQQRKTAASRTTSGARWSLFVSLDDGMQTLTDTLAERLSQASVRTRSGVDAIEYDGNWRIRVSNGQNVEADALILATPAHVSAKLLRTLSAELSAELDGVSYASSATVNLAYRADQVPHPLDGFGFVVPNIEARSIIACTYSSVKYAGRAPDGHVLLRSFVGGSLQQELFEQDDAAMVRSVRAEMKNLLGISGEPILSRVQRHLRAMPQYRVGHLDRVQRIDNLVATLPRLALAGNAYRGVGIPDCIHSGEMAAESLCGPSTL